MNRILFIDRDGTLVKEPHDFQIDAIDKIRLCTGVFAALQELLQAGFRLVMVSNQDGLGTPVFPLGSFQPAHNFILDMFASQGIRFSEIFICPHRVEDHCNCRKPLTGLLDAFIADNPLDMERCWVIGDRDSDRMLADNLGITWLPISPEHGWKEVAEAILRTPRKGSVSRVTKETNVRLSVLLDSVEESSVHTPIGFFSHMLEQVAKHGGFQLQVHATGDVEVDDHHLVEDCALALGEALKQALGDKHGIGRYGFTLPMDEALANLSMDICGRPFCEFNGKLDREFVGGMATEMVPHFFKSLSHGLGATMHISVTGENHHHMIESCFKALGRTLRQAMTVYGTELPSTKGIL